jgi:hypothetical protein
MPGAAGLVDQPVDGAVLVDAVVRTHPRRGVAQALEGLGGALHARVVQQQNVDRLARGPGVVVGRRALDGSEHHRDLGRVGPGAAERGVETAGLANPRMVQTARRCSRTRS